MKTKFSLFLLTRFKASSSLTLMLIFFCVGCLPQTGENKILTSNIFNRSELEIDFFESKESTIDLGEHLLTSPYPEIKLHIKNNSSYPYTQLGMSFISLDDVPTSVTYKLSMDGDSVFPGNGGTCATTLAPGASCSVVILFNLNDQRLYREKVTFTYNNLVSPENISVNFKVLSGMPASLVFFDETTRFTFGSLIGLQEKPIVERENSESFEKVVRIENRGGLSARSITFIPNETCRSVSTQDCPTGMSGAFTYENINCPQNLQPAEGCELRIRFKPKNDSVPPSLTLDDIFEINYKYNLRLSYLSDSKNNVKNLNGYFESNSTNIQANFTSSSKEINFSSPVLGGNRQKQIFRLLNNGYREGTIKKLNFRDSDNSLIASCYKPASGSVLDCFKPDNSPLSLETLPFKLVDLNSCVDDINQSINATIDVDGSCIFELIYQPSTLHITNQSYQNIIMSVTFDARWKDQPTVLEKKISTINASSLAPGRLVIANVSYLAQTYTPNSTDALVDFGRITLQGSSFFKRNPIVIVLRNEGSHPISLVSIRDGIGRNLPLGTPTNLGATNPPYYSAVNPTNSCADVQPNQTCQITMNFAAIGFPLDSQENENMFDFVSPTHGQAMGAPSYKSFEVSYKSGALFTDTNFTDAVDFPDQKSILRLTGLLVRKGMLQEIADHPTNFGPIGTNYVTQFDEVRSHIILQNIGTGPIPYIRLQRRPDQNFSLEATTNLATLGVDHDCLSLIDAPIPANIPFDRSPSDRQSIDSATFSQLGTGESCALTLRTKIRALHYNQFPSFCSVFITPEIRANQAFSRISTGEWEVCNTLNLNLPTALNVAFFDGDFSNPSATDPVYGTRFEIPQFNRIVRTITPAKIVPYVTTPFLSSLIYRSPINYSTLPSGPSGFTDAAMWFWNVESSLLFTHSASSLAAPFFVKAASSLANLSSISPTGFSTKDNYDYYIHLGSFSQNSPEITSTLLLDNLGMKRARITRLEPLAFPSSPEFTLSLPSTPLDLAGANQLSVPFTLSTLSAGEKLFALEIEYSTGAFDNVLHYTTHQNIPSNSASLTERTRTKKVLIGANISASLPTLAASVRHYDISQNASGSPTVMIHPSSQPISLSYNTQPPLYSLAFDSIKLTSTLPAPEDMFDQKQIIFTNNSTTALHDFSLSLQSTVTQKNHFTHASRTNPSRHLSS